MIIATWNVNGIRKRQAELQDFLDRDHPDIVCLQEIKAEVDQLPVWLCELEGYWCYWHGGKGYSGVALHVSKSFAPERPAFSMANTGMIVTKIPAKSFATSIIGPHENPFVS